MAFLLASQPNGVDGAHVAEAVWFRGRTPVGWSVKTPLNKETHMPGGLIAPYLTKREKSRYTKQMDQIVKLLRTNNEQVERLIELMERMLKGMPGL
jgi:hypothetical protein